MTIATSEPTAISTPPVAQSVCIVIHGHFYQPPRENPYLNVIEQQESAAPFHDWNHRILFECYRPNAFARVETHDGQVLKVVNNYEYLSFNIGPTLLSWLEAADPEVYRQILLADRHSAERLGGHGNAIAQVYNHIIMPLANWRDKLTQIRWGRADFRQRFGREPEGMWLAETAVDRETLEALVQEGLRFIVLAPSQAQRCRPMGAEGEQPWLEVGGSQIDPTRPYRCFVDDGKESYIDVFFYDGPISRDMGFGPLLNSSSNFAHRLGQAVRGDRPQAQIVSVATDGETFGHHKHFTEKTLAYAFTVEFPQRDWAVTNYAHYLSQNPPTWEVVLKPVTAWSCAHGVGRWQDDCGCGVEVGKGLWRQPLRESLNWLRDRLIPIYVEAASAFFNDVWAARDGYMELLRESLRHHMAQNSELLESFFLAHGDRALNTAEQVQALQLLEMQRHSLLMFTSCGWFFEELSRPEGVQILRYASRAMELAAEVSGVFLEPEFIDRLSLAPSAVFGDGAAVYRQMVVTNRIGLRQIAANYAIGSLFTTYQRSQPFFCYTIQQQDYHLERLGTLSLAIGQIQITSSITLEAVTSMFAVLHLGGDDFHCHISSFDSRREYEQSKQHLIQAFRQASAATVVLAMVEHFGGDRFNLRHLFVEERHRLLHLLARETLNRLDQLYAQVYLDNYSLLASFRREGLPVPTELQVAAQITLEQRLHQELQRLEQGETLPLPEVQAVVSESRYLGCALRSQATARALTQYLMLQIRNLSHDADLTDSLGQIEETLNLAEALDLDLDRQSAQEQVLTFLQRVIAPRCHGAVSYMEELLGDRPPLSFSAPLCEKLTNLELQHVLQVAARLKISPLSWLPQP